MAHQFDKCRLNFIPLFLANTVKAEKLLHAAPFVVSHAATADATVRISLVHDMYLRSVVKYLS